MSFIGGKRIHFKGWPCVIRFARYAINERTAIQLVHADEGDLVATVTVNMPNIPLGADEVIIKDYSENEGMLDALVAAGIVEDTGKRVPLPFGNSAPICRILDDLKGDQK